MPLSELCAVTERELDNLRQPKQPPKRTRAPPAHHIPGIRWNPQTHKWYGRVTDRIAVGLRGGRRFKYTNEFEDDRQCAKELKLLRDQEGIEYAAEIERRLSIDPRLAGASLAPRHAYNARLGKVYYKLSPATRYQPVPVIAVFEDDNVSWVDLKD